MLLLCSGQYTWARDIKVEKSFTADDKKLLMKSKERHVKRYFKYKSVAIEVWVQGHKSQNEFTENRTQIDQQFFLGPDYKMTSKTFSLLQEKLKHQLRHGEKSWAVSYRGLCIRLKDKKWEWKEGI